MGGKKSRYRKLWKRWLIIEAVSGMLCLILYFPGDNKEWLGFWFIFSLFMYHFTGPGVIMGRVYAIQEERGKRIGREFNESWERANPEWVLGSKRRLNWIHDMKDLATETYEDKEGEKMYVIPGLSDPIPLDYLEDIADFDDWKEYVAIYMDWEQFKEEYPWMDSFSDYDKRKHKMKIQKENLDYLDDDEYFDKYYDRHMRWIEAMKDQCTYKGGGPAGEDTYSSPLLWNDIPLNDLKMFAGSKTFNYHVSQYIDWDEFHLNFPDLETWEDDEEGDD